MSRYTVIRKRSTIFGVAILAAVYGKIRISIMVLDHIKLY